MSIQLQLPEGLQVSQFELSMLFAVKLFEEGLITSSQGVKMVGLSKHVFIELLGKQKAAIFQYDIEQTRLKKTLPMPEELVMLDVSPLSALVDIGQVDLLRQMYQRVLITDVVRREIHADLPAWMEVSTEYEAQQYQLLCLELDAGEASAIALALKQASSRMILDERKGRIVAKRLNLKVTGTVGLIIKAKEAGFITSGKAVLAQLEKQGFWLSEKLKRQDLARMGESEND